MKLHAAMLAPLAAFAAAAPVMAPQLLAFPYRTQVGATTVWSVTPLPEPQTRQVVDRANALVAASPIARMPERRRVFLTDGGWRWHWLALGASGGFALTRAASEAVIVNRNDLGTDRVWNSQAVGGERTLSGVIAHETCHGMERRRYGLAVQWAVPAWLFEGYCDYVARESSLSDADAARIRAQDRQHPALVYYEGRRRVAAELAANGGSVDKLFAAH